MPHPRHERRRDRPRRGPRALRRAAGRARLRGAALRDGAPRRRGARGAATSVGFPLLVRPSYVLGGRAMEIVYSRDGLADYLEPQRRPRAARRDLPRPLPGERDRGRRRRALRRRGRLDRRDHAARRGGRHPLGRPACVLPPHSLGHEMLEQIRAQTRGIALGLGVVGLLNVQFAVHGGELYVIEANPRASRTVPFVSKAIGVPLAKMACRLMLGERIADLGLPADAMRRRRTWRSRRRCCRSTASRAPTRCSARRCARPARSWASPATSRRRSPRPRPRPARRCPPRAPRSSR